MVRPVGIAAAARRRRVDRTKNRRSPLATFVELLKVDLFHFMMLDMLKDIRDVLNLAKFSTKSEKFAKRLNEWNDLHLEGGSLDVRTFTSPLPETVPADFLDKVTSFHLNGCRLPDPDRDLKILAENLKCLTTLSLHRVPDVKSLDFRCFDGLESLDLSDFPGLEHVTLPDRLPRFDASNSKDLRMIFNATGVETIVVSGCDSLQTLDFSRNLKHFDCSGSRIDQLDVREATGLVTLNCSGNCLESLDLSSLKLLEELDCSDNRLTSLKLPWYTHFSSGPLKIVKASGNLFRKVPIMREYWSLRLIDLSGNLLEGSFTDARLPLVAEEELTVDIGRNPLLRRIDLVSFYDLRHLRCNGCSRVRELLVNSELVTLECRGNRLADLNLIDNGKLEHLDVRENRHLDLLVRMNVRAMEATILHDRHAEVQFFQLDDDSSDDEDDMMN